MGCRAARAKSTKETKVIVHYDSLSAVATSTIVHFFGPPDYEDKLVIPRSLQLTAFNSISNPVGRRVVVVVEPAWL